LYSIDLKILLVYGLLNRRTMAYKWFGILFNCCWRAVRCEVLEEGPAVWQQLGRHPNPEVQLP